jgi:hypothetical protein
LALQVLMEKMEPLVYLLLAVAHLAQPVLSVQLAHKEHKETQVQLVQPDQQVVEAEAQDRQDQKGKQELLVWLGLRMFTLDQFHSSELFPQIPEIQSYQAHSEILLMEKNTLLM